MFQIGDLVIVDFDLSNTIRKIESVELDGSYVLDGDVFSSHEEDELTLVKSADTPPEVPAPIVPNTPSRTIEDIHDDIQKMFVQIVQFYEREDVDKQLKMRITAEYYPGSSDVTVKYIACVGYNEDVESRNMFKSVQIACERFKENEAIKPKEIPFYKPAE